MTRLALARAITKTANLRQGGVNNGRCPDTADAPAPAADDSWVREMPAARPVLLI